MFDRPLCVTSWSNSIHGICIIHWLCHHVFEYTLFGLIVVVTTKSHTILHHICHSTIEVTIINWFVVCNEVGEAQESSFVAQSFAIITSVPQL
jgi:hypothetical protein